MLTEQERLQTLMQKEELNAKDFAAEVGISAATMSNILGGRNKPSLEVMQKVLGRFRHVNCNWLILGTGSMYNTKDAQDQTLFDLKPEASEPLNEAPQPVQQAAEPVVTGKTKSNQPAVQVVERVVEKKVKKVLIFFEDGTFQEL